MGKVTLVTGGARSGKSTFAERLAAGRGKRVIYVATAQALDDEMGRRILRHQARRPPSWITQEAPIDLRGVITELPEDIDAVLIDCLSLWVSNRLLSLDEVDGDAWWDQVTALEATLCQDVESVVHVAHRSSWHLILVTNEVGCGVVPATRLGRAFRDLLGRINQVGGAEADSVFLMVAGIGVDLKSLATTSVE